MHVSWKLSDVPLLRPMWPICGFDKLRLVDSKVTLMC
jgi:hypothetical protein